MAHAVATDQYQTDRSRSVDWLVIDDAESNLLRIWTEARTQHLTPADTDIRRVRSNDGGLTLVARHLSCPSAIMTVPTVLPAAALYVLHIFVYSR